MAKIEKLKKGTATIYPATIPQAVVDPTSGKSAREELDEKASHGYESSPKTLKQVDDSVSQLAGEVSLLDAVQGAKIKDIESIISTMNPNQSAQLSVSGVSPLLLPKNAANGGMEVKLEGLTEDVGGVITNFKPTGRVRSVDKNGLNPTYLYLTAPELRSNGTVKDEIRKGANGYELVKRVGVGTLGDELIANGGFDTNTDWGEGAGWTISGGTANFTGTGASANIVQTNILTVGKWYRIQYTVLNHVQGTVQVNGFETSEGRSANGTYTEYRKAFYTHAGLRGIGTAILSVDNFSVKEITEQDAILATSGFTELGSIVNYTLETPEVTPISYGGILNSAESGTVYHEPVIADAGVYETNLPILMQDYPIATIEEIIKHENGVDTYLNAATAVIAGDGLSFTHPDLADGDLVLFTYAYSKESTNGNITATFYDSNVVKIDTVTGKAYKIEDVITDGVLTRTLTEV